jgi:hypothetical protein
MATGEVTARTYPVGGTGSRCGSDQRAVMLERVRAAGRGFYLAVWARSRDRRPPPFEESVSAGRTKQAPGARGPKASSPGRGTPPPDKLRIGRSYVVVIW